jgi:protein phosphatase methylesterase 1
MSDLQRSFVRVKLAQLPREAPIMAEGEDEADTLSTLSDSSSASSASSTGTIKPLPSRKLFSTPAGCVKLVT